MVNTGERNSMVVRSFGAVGLLSRSLFVIALLLTAAVASAADPDGEALYKARCSSCHDASARSGSRGRAPSHDELATRKPESVFMAMFGGAMDLMSTGLTDDEGRAIARYVTGKDFSPVSTPI